ANSRRNTRHCHVNVFGNARTPRSARRAAARRESGGTMSETLERIRTVLDNAVVEDPETGLRRAKRSIFTDEELFELEMKYIFASNWVYLAHESQIPDVGDYFTTCIGRVPVVSTRDKQGELNALINSCSHRGAMLCRRKTDNRVTLTCPFHGW